MNNPKKIFVTGGHITPAIAVIDALRQSHPDWEVLLIGRNALEKRLASEKHIRYLPSSAGRMSDVFGVLAGFVQAMLYCIREKPQLVVSFGGYVALPVAISAWVCGIPVITHEQTRMPGRANRWIGKIARKICVTFADSAGKFPAEKTTVTGLPVRNELFHPSKNPPFSLDKNRPIIYITGGSTGAQSLNVILFPVIAELTRRYTVVHQTGVPSLAKAGAIKNAHYVARDFFDVHTISWIYHHAQLVISRSGANTVMELAMLGKQAILIPLPWSAGGEQMANAQWLEQLGLAAIVEQSTIRSKPFAELIGHLMNTAQVISPFSISRNGAYRVACEIDAILR